MRTTQLRIAVLSCAIPLVLQACGSSSNSTKENYLYVNVAAEGGANDQIAVVDARDGSATFGKIVRMIDLGSKANEPHHTGISPDGKTGYFMGLFLPGRIWSMDLTQPIAMMSPKILVNDAAKEIGYNNPDEFVQMSDGRFLVSFMGSAGATVPGAIAMFSPAGAMMTKFEVPNTDTSSKTYNPHGFDVRTDIGRMANGNFIMPADAAGLSGADMPGSTFRNGLTIWKFDGTANTASILHTYDLSMGMPMHDGIMDSKMLPNDSKGRVLATNMRGGEVWLATTLEPFDAKPVITGLMFPQLIQLTKDGKTMFVTTYLDNMIHKFDITDPEHPVEKGSVVGPQGSTGGTPSGAHYCKLSTDEGRIYVTSYFVNLADDVTGIAAAKNPVNFSGVRQLWGATTADMKLIPNFDVDFAQNSLSISDGTTLSGGPFGPHGIILDK